jgi:DUF4097 and DUF4098 domain-containing protein YvlB
MRKRFLLPALAAGVLCLTGCEMDLGDFDRHSQDFHFGFPLSANGRLSVETFNGSVEVSTWDRDTVDISGTKYGPSSEAVEALNVNIDHSPDAVSVRVVRPSNVRGNRGARFVIKVPRGVTLDRLITSNGAIRTEGGNGPARLKTSNGAIHVAGLNGNLDAQTSNSSMELLDIEGSVTGHTSNGRVRAERIRGGFEVTSSNAGISATVAPSAKPVRLETSNGSVDVRLEDDHAGDLRVTTSNASITVRMAGEPSARVMARTSNGSIRSDFSVRARGEIGKSRLDGELGNGGKLLDLTTSNGSIHLARWD